MLYGNKPGNLRISGCFFSTTALSTTLLLSGQSPSGSGFSSRAAYDTSYVASKKLLSAEGKGDGGATAVKSAAHLSRDSIELHRRQPESHAAGAGPGPVVVR
jgi:hypothetical protein